MQAQQKFFPAFSLVQETFGARFIDCFEARSNVILYLIKRYSTRLKESSLPVKPTLFPKYRHGVLQETREDEVPSSSLEADRYASLSQTSLKACCSMQGKI